MNIALRSAADQAEAVRSGVISASELLDLTIERYERLNPAINAVVATQLDVARGRAGEADEATARGESWGPLHGVPMTIKEAWDWVGSASTSGYPERVDWRPERNSEAVQRLLDAGAVIYGKTNLPVGMSDWQTFNPVYGTTGNPWNPDLIPGGSSGGAAAALAAGLTALELGQRHRRVDPKSGALLRCVRPQADVRPGARCRAWQPGEPRLAGHRRRWADGPVRRRPGAGSRHRCRRRRHGRSGMEARTAGPAACSPGRVARRRDARPRGVRGRR